MLRITPEGKIVVEGQALGTENVRQFALSVGRGGDSVKLPVIEFTKRDASGRVSFRVTALFRDEAPPQAKPAGKE
jgi:hypothetical protein